MSEPINDAAEFNSTAENLGGTGGRKPPPTPSARKERRIGTVSMGVCLVFTGLILLITLFNPGINLLSIAKLAPLILIMLGVEILFNYFRHNGAALRYDFVGSFFCFFLIVLSLGISSLLPIYREYGPANWTVVSNVEEQIYDVYYTQLSSNKNITSMGVEAQLRSAKPETQDFSYIDMKSGDIIYMNFQLDSGVATDALSFARSCHEIMATAASVSPLAQQFSFYADSEAKSYSLTLDDKFSFNLSLEKMASLVKESIA